MIEICERCGTRLTEQERQQYEDRCEECERALATRCDVPETCNWPRCGCGTPITPDRP